MKHARLKAGLLATLALTTAGTGVAGPRWTGQGQIDLRAGEDRRVGRVDILQPLLRGETSLLFLDLRGVGTSEDTTEGNFGLGWRQLDAEAGSILGAYAFFDRRHTHYGNDVNQLTTGFERLGRDWDLRLNAYLPESGRMPTTTRFIPSSGVPFLSGSSVLVPGNATVRSFERALRGADLELGRTLPGLPCLRAFVAAYRFDAPDVRHVGGGRLRLDMRLNAYLGAGVTLQHDNVRHTDAFLELRFRMPLGGPRERPPAAAFESRMTDAVERDIDLVTQPTRTTRVSAGPATPVVGADGQPLHVLYVDNRAAGGGAGTVENPFSTLKAAEAASSPRDIIYVSAGDGTSRGMSDGIVLKDFQQLLGEGVGLTVNGFTLRAAGNQPLVTSTGHDVQRDLAYTRDQLGVAVEREVATVAAARANVIAGLSLANGNTVTSLIEMDCPLPGGGGFMPCGYFTRAYAGTVIYRMADATDSLHVTDNRIDVSRGPGIVLDAQPGTTLNADVERNTFASAASASGGAALGMSSPDRFSTTRSSLHLTLKDNNVEISAGTGIDIRPGRGADLRADVSGNRFSSSGTGSTFHQMISIEYGISDVTGVVDARFSDNAMSGSQGSAIYLWTAPSTSLLFERNAITGNAGGGVFLDTRDGVTTATFRANTITGNGGDGDVVLNALTFNGARIDATFESNTIGTIVRP